MNPKQDSIERAKKNAAREAVKLVEDGFVIGLGSGSTAAHAIERIGERVRREGLHVSGVPTSYQALTLAAKHHIPITTLEEHPTLDLTIDGADQIDDELNLIKGMGGALAREKIVAASSEKLIIVADESKKVKTLGEDDQPVPTEVLPFAVPLALNKMKEMKGNPVLREAKGKIGPVITDNGNVILDVNFGLMHDPNELNLRLKQIPGVVETGLFINMATTVFLGSPSTVRKIDRKS